jgi:hypothetical protein
MSHFMWTARAVLFGAAMVSSVLLFAVPASAAAAVTVDHGSVTSTDEFDDPDTCAAEGFTVHAVQHETILFNFRFDANGQFLSGFAHHDLSFEISANGRTIHESDHYNNKFAPDGSSVAAGNEAHIRDADGKLILLDAGRIVFDAADNVTFIAGRHPQFLGETFCAALLPN